MEWQIILLNLLYAVAGVGLNVPVLPAVRRDDAETASRRRTHRRQRRRGHRHLWTDHSGVERRRFMFGSYNAGRLTLLRAQQVAQRSRLNPLLWPSIEAIAHLVPRWRHIETLNYVRRIESAHARMDARGAVAR
jgi:hypothetical protein